MHDFGFNFPTLKTDHNSTYLPIVQNKTTDVKLLAPSTYSVNGIPDYYRPHPDLFLISGFWILSPPRSSSWGLGMIPTLNFILLPTSPCIWPIENSYTFYFSSILEIAATQSVALGPVTSASGGGVLGPSPDLLTQDLHFNKIPSGFIRIWNFWKALFYFLFSWDGSDI